MTTYIRTCKVDGCTKKHVANGLCRRHYDQRRNDSRFKCRQLAEALTRITEIAESPRQHSDNMQIIARLARTAVNSVADSTTEGPKS